MRFVIVDFGVVLDGGYDAVGRDVYYVRPSSDGHEWILSQVLRWIGERCECFIVDSDAAITQLPGDDLLIDSDSFLSNCLAITNVRAALPKGGMQLSPLAIDTIARLLRGKKRNNASCVKLAEQVEALRNGGPHT